MIGRGVIIVCLVVLSVFTVGAQDIHFSQFWMAPANYNPGMTGIMERGCERYIANRRSQWKSVTVPYVTYGLAADRSQFLKSKKLSLGAKLYYDNTGDSRFTTLDFNVGAAYQVWQSKDSTHRVQAGLQIGLLNRSIDYTALQFDAQYNGFFYDPSLPNNEVLGRDSRLGFNANTGAAYVWTPGARKRLEAGISLFNLPSPNQSFFDDLNIALDRRFNFHMSGGFPVAPKVDVLPGVLWSAQGTYREFLIGGRVRYYLVNEEGIYRAVYLGGFARTRDAGFITAGLDYDEWTVNISYDINLSDLTPASNNKGGLEIAVAYRLCRGRAEPGRIKHIICPDYL